MGSSRFYSAFSAGNRFGVSKIFHVTREAGSSPRFSTPAPPGCFALALTWVVRLPINIMSLKTSVAGRTDCACVGGPGDPGPELSLPPLLLGLNLVCAVIWVTLQGILTAGSKTEMYLIICAWAIHLGNALCVRWCTSRVI